MYRANLVFTEFSICSLHKNHRFINNKLNATGVVIELNIDKETAFNFPSTIFLFAACWALSIVEAVLLFYLDKTLPLLSGVGYVAFLLR